MTPEMGLVLFVLAAAVVLFVTEWLRLDVVALCVLIALLASGILTTEEALAGFSSTSVLSIAALFVVGGAVFQTGLAAMAGDRILRAAGTRPTRLLIVLTLAITVMSAFISSTGVVALMLPAVMSIAQRANIPPSKLLMPLAFSALMGGALTLIATPPNIIASEALADAGYTPFQFFSFTPIGALLALVGITYMATLGSRLLPDRRPTQIGQRMETPGELFELYRLPDGLYRLRIHPESTIIGQTLAQLHPRDPFNLTVVNVNRGGRTIHHPHADLTLALGDILIVQCSGTDVGRAAAAWSLGLMANAPIQKGDIITNEVGIAEVLLRPRSNLLDRTIAEVNFGTVYRLTVLNLYRPGASEPPDIKTTPLKFGDVLLVQGEWKDIFALKRLRHDFIVMGEPEALQTGAFLRLDKAPTVLFILVAMVLAILLNIASLTLASLAAAVALVLTGCLKMNEAYESIDWKSIVLIAGLLPMSTALVKVGLVDAVALWLTGTLGELGVPVVLAGLFLLTGIMTQLLSNTVTALLLMPLAITTAQGLGVAPQGFVMAVAVAASMAFLSPVASPVNTLVMSSGNYRFGDYARVGAPLFVIAFIITMLAVPVLFPF
ncbi:MAG: SLC13 family permease [Anaerolineae bacterium]|jgi:di/tricarboxylate transporter|nr:SLC13 family permease [Anaerolineae bacterium]